jgi:hypothetical protein
MLFLWCSDAKAGDCQKSIRPIVKELTARMKALQASIPSFGAGPQVQVGSCASRLKKLAGNFLCCKTHQNTAHIWEEISCIDLKRHYLEKTCSCPQTTGGYTTDEILQDEAFEQYEVVKRLGKIALKKGISNKIIGEYIAGASKYVDCINYRSIERLREIERQLSDVIEDE